MDKNINNINEIKKYKNVLDFGVSNNNSIIYWRNLIENRLNFQALSISLLLTFYSILLSFIDPSNLFFTQKKIITSYIFIAINCFILCIALWLSLGKGKDEEYSFSKPSDEFLNYIEKNPQKFVSETEYYKYRIESISEESNSFISTNLKLLNRIKKIEFLIRTNIIIFLFALLIIFL